MSHFTTLVILPYGSTQVDVYKHLEAFDCLLEELTEADLTSNSPINYSAYTNALSERSIKEYTEERLAVNPFRFFDYYRHVWFPIWDEDKVYENNTHPNEFISCHYLADVPYPEEIEGFMIPELRDVVFKLKLDSKILMQTVKVDKHPFRCNTIVTPTGLVYCYDDYEDKQEFYDLCHSIYTQYRDGYVAWALDCHV